MGAKTKTESLLDAILAQGPRRSHYCKNWWESFAEHNPSQYAELEAVCLDYINHGKTREACGSMKELHKRLLAASAIPKVSVIRFRCYCAVLAEQ